MAGKLKIYLSSVFLCGALFIAGCNKGDDTTSTKVKCVTCANGGSCIDDTCRCLNGWEGSGCLTQTRTKMVGTWTVAEDGSNSAAESYSMFIQTTSATQIDQISFSHIHSIFSVVAIVTKDSVIIPSQTKSGQKIEGSGYYRANGASGDATIIMRYAVTNTSTGVVNDFGYFSPSSGSSVWTR
ncbi:MAG: hypothetical protein V4649_11080 [Bacteroidota bacterium]